MKPTLLFLAALICFAPVLSSAEGGRLAFVVGVDRYENLPAEAQLSVAVSDARRMKETLESLDPPFTVRMVADGDVRGVESAFDAFLDEAKGAECALVYFAGHGVEYHGANFLLVKDTAIDGISPDIERMKRRLATQAVSLQGWVDSLDATQAQVKLVILDCCRDNPLKAEDGSGTRAVVGASRGLAQVTPPSGTLISYSADAGQRANDGLFTEVLANNLKTPGLSILKVFAKTREEVREISTAWAEEDASRGLAPDSRRSRHEPAEYNKLNLAGTDFAFTRGGIGEISPGIRPKRSHIGDPKIGTAMDRTRLERVLGTWAVVESVEPKFGQFQIEWEYVATETKKGIVFVGKKTKVNGKEPTPGEKQAVSNVLFKDLLPSSIGFVEEVNFRGERLQSVLQVQFEPSFLQFHAANWNESELVSRLKGSKIAAGSD